MAPGPGLAQREPELQQLAGAVERAASGSGGFVLVRGPAGIGKSSLLREFISRLGANAFLLFGMCDDMASPRPLEPLWEMADLEPRLLPALRKSDPRAVFEVLMELLARRSRPTVVVIDDIHWADQATLDLLLRVGRRVDRTHGLVVVAFRDEDTPLEHPLRRVIADVPPEAMVRVAPQPLNSETIADLTGEDRADELLLLTGGNPLLVTEMIRTGSEVPASIYDLVRARLGRLPRVARSIVELVSVSPGACPLDLSLPVSHSPLKTWSKPRQPGYSASLEMRSASDTSFFGGLPRRLFRSVSKSTCTTGSCPNWRRSRPTLPCLSITRWRRVTASSAFSLPSH